MSLMKTNEGVRAEHDSRHYLKLKFAHEYEQCTMEYIVKGELNVLMTKYRGRQ